MKPNEFKEGQVFRSKIHPEKDFKIRNIVEILDQYWDDDSISYDSIICWDIANDVAWCNHICKKYNMYSIEEIIQKRGSTFPFATYGERNIKSTNSYIKKYNLELIKE